jgi:hypothetical protein
MPLDYAANDSNREKMVKRVSFMLGLMNVGVSGFIIGAYPTMYYLWYAVACFPRCNTPPVAAADALARYTPKAVIFCLARWIDFRKQKRHYLLYEQPFAGLFISPLCFLAFTRIRHAATISATGPTPHCFSTCGCFLTAPPSSRFVSWLPTGLWYLPTTFPQYVFVTLWPGTATNPHHKMQNHYSMFFLLLFRRHGRS